MDRKLAVGVLTFVAVQVLGGLGLAAALDLTQPEMPWLQEASLYLLVMPLALVAALRSGRIGYLSLLCTSALVVVAIQFTIVAILDSLARPAGGSVEWSDLYSAIHFSSTVRSAALMLAVPLVWLAALRRFAPGLASNNSFKPKPLRGSA